MRLASFTCVITVSISDLVSSNIFPRRYIYIYISCRSVIVHEQNVNVIRFGQQSPSPTVNRINIICFQN